MYNITLTGCLSAWVKDNLEVSLINAGLPSLASIYLYNVKVKQTCVCYVCVCACVCVYMYLPVTDVAVLAVYMPNASRVRPAAFINNITSKHMAIKIGANSITIQGKLSI